MGSLNAAAMAEAVSRKELSFQAALEWHLTANMWPPKPAILAEACEAAITAVMEGDGERPIKLPEGIAHSVYTEDVPAQVIVEELRLEEFLVCREDEAA